MCKKFYVLSLAVLFLFILAACNPGTSDQARVDEALEAINIPEELTGDLTLPIVTSNMSISFTSSNPSVLSNAGIVDRQNEDVSVTFTATISLNDVAESKVFTIVVKALSTEALLSEALAQLTLPSTVTSDITLPTLSGNKFSDVVVTFASNNPSVISNTGQVTRLTVDTTVAVTITAAVGVVNDSKVVNVNVTARPMTSLEIVTEFKDNFVFNLNQLTEDIVLPTSEGQISIAWSSSHPDVLDGSGNVNRPYVDNQTVTLTANFTYDGESVTRSFDVVVLGIALDDINPTLSDITITLEQETLDKEVNALITITGYVYFLSGERDRTVTLVVYYLDDTVLARIPNILVAEDGSFEFEVRINDYFAGWDWYKFKLELEEDELLVEDILIPFTTEEVSIIAVLKGNDGDIRSFMIRSNEGYLNVSTSGVDNADKTDFYRVLADSERLTISSSIIAGYTLPSSTGQWGQGSTITWQADNADYAVITDNVIDVLESTASTTFTATITYDDATITKTFTVELLKGSVSFENNTATFDEVENGYDVLIDMHIVGDIITEDLVDRVFTLVAYITPSGQPEEVLHTYQNLSSSDEVYHFVVNLNALTFNGEWIKFRIEVEENSDITKYEFLDGFITIPVKEHATLVDGEISYFIAGNEWDMFYVRKHTGLIVDDASIHNIKLEVIEDRVYLVITGFAHVFENYYPLTLELSIKNVDGRIQNTEDNTDPRFYEFRVDLTELAADGDWRDINLHITQEILGETYIYQTDFYAPWWIKDELNNTYELVHNNRYYGFKEWESGLKVVIENAS